tara:strand:+ start:292 stop:570 length:279 start_codon:yes stop_codon:yes gene_type:complete
MPLIEVEIYNGERITGETWEDILHALKAMNFNDPKDLEELKTRLRHRIKVFTGNVIGAGTHEDFGYELQRVGFLKILPASEQDDGSKSYLEA